MATTLQFVHIMSDQAIRDLFLAQRFARHVSPLTTVVYTHPSDDEMSVRLRDLGC